MYSKGKGVPQDDKEAVKWLKLAAEQGHPKAQNNLGMLYRFGKGVPQDYKEAVKWYHLSAEQGNEEAQFMLGEMYALGRGVPQDDKEGIKFFSLSAEQGYAKAQFVIGVAYLTGETAVLKDYVLAHMWFNLCSPSGNKDCVRHRDIIEKRMSPSQIEKAQEMARNWKPTYK